MRHALYLCLLAAGCEDFNKLESDFCSSARVHFVPDGGTSGGLPAHLAQLCDDFEDDDVNTTLWDTKVVGGSLGLEHYDRIDASAEDGNDPGYAYRGRGVFHAIAPANSAAQLVETHVTGHQDTPGIRAFVWPGRGEVVGETSLFELLDETGNVVRKLTLINGTPWLSDTVSGQTQMATGQLTPGQWNCVNLFSRGTRMDVVVDNGSNGVLPGLSPVHAVATRIGPSRGNDTNLGPSEMWLDEVIIDDSFVGCSP